MIGKLTGTVIEKEHSRIILDVHGVGYSIRLLHDTALASKIGETLTVWTHLVVREDALELFGFTKKEELGLFMLLIGISGIGPKSALSILSLAPPKILEKAVVSGDTTYLTKVSGIGKKSAEKIILELKDKLKSVLFEEGEFELKEDTDVLLALKSLGYKTSDAREALKKIPKDVSGTNSRIKEALRYLNS